MIERRKKPEAMATVTKEAPARWADPTPALATLHSVPVAAT